MTAPSKAPRTEQEVSRWFGWLRPAFSIPAFALLLAVIAYQGWTNLRLRQSAGNVQFLASAVVNLDVRAGEPIRVPASAGHPFELSVNLPPEAHYSTYKLNLYNQGGGLEWSRTVQAGDSGTLSLYVPGNGPVPGALAVQGVTAAGESVDLGRFRIELQD